MFGNLGAPEILVILVVALIVFGPKRLPEVGRQVGAAMRELRRMQDSVRAEIDTVMRPDLSPDSTTPSDDSGTQDAGTLDSSLAALPPPNAHAGGEDGFAEPPGSFT
jgi:TatA/E family protein of Tat protein translocase